MIGGVLPGNLGRDLARELRATRALKTADIWTPTEKQQLAIDSPADELFFGGQAGGGKGACVIEGVIWTPTGPKSFEKIKKGNRICDVFGGTQQVLGVYPRGEIKALRVHFDDGSNVVCDYEHKWLAWRARKVVRKGTERVTSKQAPRIILGEDLLRRFERGERWQVPLMSAPAVGEFNRFQIDPYVLGALLGDGALSAGSPSVGVSERDGEIVEALKERSEGITSVRPYRGMLNVTFSKSSVEYAFLRRHGLIGKRSWEKSLPDSVLAAPIDFRWDLLRGLMDTDGWAEERRACYFTSTSKPLAEIARDLARSLGYFASITEKHPTYSHKGEKRTGRLAYMVRMKGPNPGDLFLLSRKKEIASRQKHQNLSKRVVKVERIGKREITCIAVSNPSGLYLTNGHTVTHNSDLEGHIPLYYPGSRCIVFRREAGQLDDLIDRLRLTLEPAGGEIITSRKGGALAIYPNGSSLRFGHIALDKHIQTWRGRPHEIMMFDEVSEIAERHFRALKGWKRKASALSGDKTRVLLAGNPATQSEDGQVVGKWLIRYFAPWIARGHKNPAKPGELRWFVRDRDPDTGSEYDREVPGPTEGWDRPDPVKVDRGKGEELVEPTSRTYIPSKLSDNPYQPDSYRRDLDALPEPLRSALRDGDWYSALDLDDAWALVSSEALRQSHVRWEEALRTGTEELDPKTGLRLPFGAKLVAIGVDVSRGGADDTVLILRFTTPRGDWIARPIRYPGQVIRTGGQVAQVIQKYYVPGVRIKVDAIGVGAAVVDAATALFEEAAVEPMNASAVTFARTSGGGGVTAKFRNSRGEWFWRLREGLDPEYGSGLMLPPDDRLDEELNTIRWEISSSGIGIELKERLQKRLGRSPDTADALAMACAESIGAGFVELG